MTTKPVPEGLDRGSGRRRPQQQAKRRWLGPVGCGAERPGGDLYRSDTDIEPDRSEPVRRSAKPQPLVPLVLPTTSTGTINLKADGTAQFVPASGAAVPLKFAKRTLASAGATQTSGVSLQLVVQDMVLHGGADGTYQAFFTGKDNGEDMIAQPYQGPKLAWWMSAYDLAAIVYAAADVISVVSKVISLAKSLPAIFNALRTGGQQLVSAVQCEPDNVELSERLQIIYEVLALEPE